MCLENMNTCYICYLGIHFLTLTYCLTIKTDSLCSKFYKMLITLTLSSLTPCMLWQRRHWMIRWEPRFAEGIKNKLTLRYFFYHWCATETCPSGPPICLHFHVTKCNLSHFICTHIIIYTTQIYCGRWHRLDSGQGFGWAVGGGADNYGGNEWRLGIRFRLGCWEGFIKYGASLIWGLGLLTASGGDNSKGKNNRLTDVLFV